MVRIDYTILLRKCKHVNLLGVNIELIEWNMVTSKNPQKYRQIEAFSIIGQILTSK